MALHEIKRLVRSLTSRVMGLEDKTDIYHNLVDSHSISILTKGAEIMQVNLYLTVHNLYFLEHISKEEMQNLLKMLVSPDKESKAVGEKIIKELHNKHFHDTITEE